MNKELFFKQIEEIKNNKKFNSEIDSYIYNLVINNGYISFCYNELYQKTTDILPEYNISVYINIGLSPNTTTIYFKNKEIVIRNKPISDIIDRTFKELQTYSVNNISIESTDKLPDDLLKNSNNNDTYDILILFAKEAVMSAKNKDIFNPYPLVFNPINNKEKIFDPNYRDYNKISYILNNIPKLNVLIKNSNDNILTILNNIDKNAYLLIKWLILLNNLFFIRVPYELSLYKLNCNQFVILNRSPEKEQELKNLRKKYGYTYAFHGSPIENWYSIIYNGLKNYSHTKLQLHGAAYGAGVYMSPTLSTAYGYTNSTSKNSLSAIAVVEVINKDIKKNGDIWVVPNENYISLRMLLLFDNNKINYSKSNITNKDLTDELNALMIYYDILKIDELRSLDEMDSA